MDYTLTPRQEGFRAEVRAFCEREIKPHYDDPPNIGPHAFEEWHIAFNKEVARKLGAKGWLGLGWPVQYGGTPGTIVDQMVFKEVLGYYESWGLPRQAVNMVAPTILAHGTEEQKRRFIPAIARGESWWCQGYSEPGAGSDLANVQTTAILEGDHFRVNGQKVWSSRGTYSDGAFCLVRSDPQVPKHKGISMLLVDMHTPGITTRPITQMTGNSDDFSEVFFDDARIPRDCLLGGLHKGWYVAMGQLSGERSQIDFVSTLKRRLDDLTEFVRDASLRGRPVRESLVARNRLADVYIEWHITRLINWRVGWLQSEGRDTSTAASICKGMVGPLSQHLGAVAMQTLGMYGQLGAYAEHAPRAPVQGRLMQWYLKAVSRTFNAGTNEIQKNIIATRGLGLPQG